MKKIIILLLAIMMCFVGIMFTACDSENKVQTTSNPSISSKPNITSSPGASINPSPTNNPNENQKILGAVLENKKTFITENGKAVFLKNYKIGEGYYSELIMANPCEYVYVDFDSDGKEELVVNISKMQGFYLVLHYNGYDIYGYEFGIRSLSALKSDGSFMQSGGTASNYYCRMSFEQNKINIIYTAIKDSTAGKFQLNGKECSIQELNEYINDWYLKENVQWKEYDFIKEESVTQNPTVTITPQPSPTPTRTPVPTPTPSPTPVFSEGLIYRLNSSKTGYIVEDIGFCDDMAVVLPGTYQNLPVIEIGASAFKDCYLRGITIPNSVTSIGDSAFYNSLLSSVTIPNSVTKIGKGAFASCHFNKITIPDSVTSIGDYAFSGCYSLSSITIPDSVTSLGNGIFADCGSLKSVTIGNNVTSIGNNSFKLCDELTDITIPNNVTSIGSYAFYYCTSLRLITIPDSVTSIGDYAFSNCYSLKLLTIPNSVKNIGSSAFYSCSALKSITFQGTLEEWNAIEKGSSWDSATGNYTVYCTDGEITK